MGIPPTEQRHRDGAGQGSEDDSAAAAPTWKALAAVALIATVVGAGVGTATTLLVGDPGPRGPQGEPGPAGPRGAPGPPGDTSAAEDAVAGLAAELDDLDSRVSELESAGTVSEDDIADLQSQIDDLSSLASDICFELDLLC